MRVKIRAGKAKSLRQPQIIEQLCLQMHEVSKLSGPEENLATRSAHAMSEALSRTNGMQSFRVNPNPSAGHYFDSLIFRRFGTL